MEAICTNTFVTGVHILGQSRYEFTRQLFLHATDWIPQRVADLTTLDDRINDVYGSRIGKLALIRGIRWSRAGRRFQRAFKRTPTCQIPLIDLCLGILQDV